MRRSIVTLVATVALAVSGLTLVTIGSAHAEERISVGDAFNTDGPRRDGLFHGDREVSLTEFLRLGGRADLAEQVTARKQLRWTLMGSGSVIILGSIAYGLSAGACSIEPGRPAAGFEECMAENDRREKIGLGVGLAGAVIATTGFLLSKKIPPIHELRKIAGDHNRPLQVAPIVTGTSGGVVVTGSF